MNWWFVDHSHQPMTGEANMAEDIHLMELSHLHGVGILRVYTWHPKALSVGRNQKTDRFNLEYMKGQGIDYVHRPTGGKAVLHDQELTYAISVPMRSEYGHLSVLSSYHRLTEGLLKGLNLMGIKADPSALKPTSRNSSALCYDHVSVHEPYFKGGKLIGSAQCRNARAILQHGSIPFSLCIDAYIDCFLLSSDIRDKLEKGLKGTVRTLSDWGIGWKDRFEVVRALRKGYEMTMNQPFDSGGTRCDQKVPLP